MTALPSIMGKIMSLFSKGRKSERIGVVIDIGSASAMVAIVDSKSSDAAANVIWSKREAVPLKQISNIRESSKSVMTALVNVLLDFETTGRQALAAYAPGAKLNTIQCSVAAPWSYTVSKQIEYKSEESFEVTSELLHTLTEAAEKQTAETLREHETAKELGLTITARATLNTLLNGYNVENPEGKTAEHLVLVHTSVVVHTYLIEALEEIIEKVFGTVSLTVYSYALLFNCVARDSFAADRNVALLDVTFEASEVTIVREGVLRYVTHTPYGLYSLARELSAITGDTLHETVMHLDEDKINDYINIQSKKKQAEIETLFSAYIEKLTELFKETGDELAAPRHIVVHTEARHESLFSSFVTKASKQASRTSPVVQPITSLLKEKYKDNLDRTTISDSAMLLAVDFYHVDRHCLTLHIR